MANDSQHCWMLHVASVCTPCSMLLDVVACCCAKFETGQTFQPTTPKILWFRDHGSVAQQCWIRFYSSSNIVVATHVHYAWFTKTYGFYPSHDAPQVPTLLGVVASVCTPLPTRKQQLTTLLVQQYWEFLRPFARSLKLHQNRQKKNGCNDNVNIDVHARQGGPPKDLPGLNRDKISVLCSLINLKWV